MPQQIFPEKFVPSCKAFLWKNSPYTLVARGARYYALSSYFSPFRKVSSLTFVVQTMAFQAKSF